MRKGHNSAIHAVTQDIALSHISHNFSSSNLPMGFHAHTIKQSQQ